MWDNKIQLSYFSTKTFVVRTQKNLLNKVVLLNTKKMLQLMDKKKYTFKLKYYVHQDLHTNMVKLVNIETYKCSFPVCFFHATCFAVVMMKYLF